VLSSSAVGVTGSAKETRCEARRGEAHWLHCARSGSRFQAAVTMTGARLSSAMAARLIPEPMAVRRLQGEMRERCVGPTVRTSSATRMTAAVLSAVAPQVSCVEQGRVSPRHVASAPTAGRAWRTAACASPTAAWGGRLTAAVGSAHVLRGRCAMPKACVRSTRSARIRARARAPRVEACAARLAAAARGQTSASTGAVSARRYVMARAATTAAVACVRAVMARCAQQMVAA
jgi:hypothetical protein